MKRNFLFSAIKCEKKCHATFPLNMVKSSFSLLCSFIMVWTWTSHTLTWSLELLGCHILYPNVNWYAFLWVSPSGFSRRDQGKIWKSSCQSCWHGRWGGIFLLILYNCKRVGFLDVWLAISRYIWLKLGWLCCGWWSIWGKT